MDFHSQTGRLFHSIRKTLHNVLLLHYGTSWQVLCAMKPSTKTEVWTLICNKRITSAVNLCESLKYIYS